MSDFNPSGKDQKSTSLILSGIKYPFDTYLAVKFDLRWQNPTRNPVHEHCSRRAQKRCCVPPDLIHQPYTAVVLFQSLAHYVMCMSWFIGTTPMCFCNFVWCIVLLCSSSLLIKIWDIYGICIYGIYVWYLYYMSTVQALQSTCGIEQPV